MPELGIDNNGFIRNSRFLKENFGTKETIIMTPRLAKRHGICHIGSGGEAVVTAHTSPDKVSAFSFKEWTSDQAKLLYYTHRFYSTLFPDFFPKFHAAFAENQPKNKVSGTVRQKILKAQESTSSTPWSKQVKEAVDFCQTIGITEFLDHARCNFLITEEGKVFYVDTLDYRDMPDQIHDVYLDGYLQEKGYSEKEKRIIWGSLTRHRELRPWEANQNFPLQKSA